MHCYQHPLVPAVGICKACSKALCPECAADLGNGLSCHGVCEKNVNELHQIHERCVKIYGIGAHQSKVPSTNVILWSLFSLTMWAITALTYFGSGVLDIQFLVGSVVFTVALVLAIYSARRTGIKY